MLDGLKILKEIDMKLEFQTHYDLSLKVEDNKLTGYLNNKSILEFEDTENTLYHGGIGFIVESGTQSTNEIKIL
tara:strand:- start:13 stop:234 length:222 start_codon:yes stop_codon:yes gene_type:complete